MAIIPKKNPMPVQAPDIRNTNFNEVALGYDAKTAVAEAQRCLNCNTMPCVKGCPVQIQIPAFIEHIKQGNFEDAYQVIAKSSALPAVCGRVCPQESQCESKCTLGIKFEPVGIGRLERFVSDLHNSQNMGNTSQPKVNGHQIAVVGSGPAGLTCAGDLARAGYQVTVFEALHIPGGVLSYGIPEFRLPKAIVRQEVENLKAVGVKVCTNVVIGRTLTIDDLFAQGFEAVFIGSGAGLPKFMNIPGEGYNGVYSANEFLTRINLMRAYKPDSATPIRRGKRVAVIGGGNVAMDAARCAKRLGADVTIIYRRTEAELPARREEVEHAMEEGIVFRFLASPTEILGDENYNVNGIVCQRMALSNPDESGRCRPIPIQGEYFNLDVDCVIMALGTSPNPLIKNTTDGLSTTSWGGILVEEHSGKTSREGVYAGGDAVTGAATVILAMGAGKEAARAIDQSFSKQ